jgi:uncharacterized protein YjiS (DUF1127 family)
MFEIANPRRQPSSFDLERQARLARGFALSACLQGAGRGLAAWLRILVRRSVRLARNWAAERLLRQAVHALDQLDDRTLADIGVRRCGIEFAVRNGLPGRPTPKRARRQHDRSRVSPQRQAA